jgi:hypothetical protein
MAPSDPYRRNPAEDIEDLAVATVAAWVADRGTVIDTGAGHGPDFRIDYADGRFGLGEVGWHTDPAIQRLWGQTFRRDRHQQIELRPGSGQWSLKLAVGASIGRLAAGGLQQLVDIMLDDGVTRLEIWPDRPRTELADTARRLCIEYASQVSPSDPAGAIFFLPSQPGAAIPQDPDAITDWVDEVLADPDYRDTTAKLLALDADERHVFLMAGSRTDRGVEERLRRLQSALPTRRPRVPSGITHVWLVAQFGGDLAALWRDESGWSAQPVVNPPAPDPDG